MNIMDNMDEARFTSGNVAKMNKQKEDKRSKDAKKNGTPMVIRNLNNQ